jgi:OPT family oligopeptide transporter
VVQLTALPLGKVLEWTLPKTRIYTFGHGWSFNPGPFSIKEHVVITVMANAGLSAYATDVLAVQRFFYGQPTSYAYQIMLLLSTQLVGFSMGGLVRPLVVWPASMLWPKALVSCALFTTLHKNFGMKKGRHISREKFLAVVVAGSFIWYWVPGYLWTGLSEFNWPCWIAPNNIPVNQLLGTVTGLGMGVITFDWSMVSILGSPLVTPVSVSISLVVSSK